MTALKAKTRAAVLQIADWPLRLSCIRRILAA